MTHIIYKTTNLVNGKFYIGKHTLNKRSKYYLGSGHALRAAIKKYGRANFVRETLYEFESIDDCIVMEKYVVGPNLIKDPMCYNISTGGIGGRLHHSDTKEQISESIRQHWIDNPGKRSSESKRQKKLVRNGKAGVATWTDESKKSFAEKTKKRWEDPSYKERVGAAISKGLKGRKAPIEQVEDNRAAQNMTQECPHCHQEIKIAAYGRWHGDRCKEMQ